LAIHLVETKLFNCSFEEQHIEKYRSRVEVIDDYLKTAEDLTGWVSYPLENHEQLFTSIEKVAEEIREVADVLVVVGVGGSFLGACAIQDALTPYFGVHKNGIEVVYVGQNLSGAYIQHLLAYLVGKSVYVNVISKSGGTMEPALAFRVMRAFMEDCYGMESSNRIIVTTDAEQGMLKQIADVSGYRQFVIPANIGGRYSVMTPVGMLPVAVAGVDFREMMSGARKAALQLMDADLSKNQAYKYAVIRHLLYEKGYSIELLASFEPSLKKFHEWWKQLFGESEGKEHKGLYPSTVTYSTDLHAIGQFIQDGSRIMFETLLHFREIQDDYVVPFDVRNEDGLNYLANCSFNEINAISKQATARAHTEGKVPVVQLVLPRLDAYHLGYLMYFFMKACAMSASLLKVNPFDQPGVETYKHKMLEALLEK